MGKTTLVLASMTLALLLACMAASSATVPGLAQTGTVTLVGAGDIARCDARDDEHTAKLINNVLRISPQTLRYRRLPGLGCLPLGTAPTLTAPAHSSPTATTIIDSPTAPATIPPALRGGASTRIERCPFWATTNTSTPQTPALNPLLTSITSVRRTASCRPRHRCRTRQ